MIAMKFRDGIAVLVVVVCSVVVRITAQEVAPPTLIGLQGAGNQEGTGVVFTCVANDTGNVTIEWSTTTAVSLEDLIRQNTGLDGTVTSVLTITNVTEAGGDYFCRARNEAGNSSFLGATLTTVLPGTDLNISARVGEVEVLVCSSDTPHVWFRCEDVPGSGESELIMVSGSGPVLITNGITNSSTLAFSPIVFGNEGCYQCVPQIQGESTTFDAVRLTVSPEGSVSVSPLNMVFERGNNVTFNCTAEGGLGNTYQWQRNGTNLDNETMQTLAITQISVNDGDQYTCVVSNAAGNDSASTSLFVYPEITLNPVDVLNAINGTMLMLACDADAFPDPQYQWVRVGGDFGDNVNGINSDMLVFAPVLFGDEGEYFCNATANGRTVQSSTSTLTVSPEGSVAVSPEMVITDVGGTVTFTCSAQGGPDNTYQWQNNGEDLMNETDTTLIISNIAAMNGGNYTCVVSNTAGNDSATAVLYVEPIIVTQPTDILTRNGTVVNFTCAAESFPAPEYIWEKYNEESGSFDTVSNGSVLEFTPAVFGDEGSYRCVASLPGTNRNATSNQAVLTVSPEGSVAVSPEMMIADVGGTVTFTCSAQGGPDNTYQWQKNGEDLMNETDTTLIIAAMNGGNYTCVVSNSAGNDSATAVLVLYVEPIIVTQPTDVLTRNGTVVNFTCAAESFPAPEYTWEEYNEESSSFDRVSNGSVLEFTPAVFGDEGSYRCVASLPGTNRNASSQLAVLTVSPEGSVAVSPEMVIADVGGTVTFNCSAQGGPNNTYQWQNDGEDLMNETDAALIISNVAAMNGGNYTCVVSNTAGNDSATAVLYVEPIIVAQPTDILTRNGTVVNFTCAAESFPAPEYTWEKSNEENSSFDRVSSGPVLEFTPAVFGDEGSYRCVASLPGTSRNATSQLAVLTVSPEGSVAVSPEMEIADVGGTVTFTCSAQGGPDNTYQWQKNGEDLMNETDTTLIVSNIAAMNGGSYTCVVRNTAGNDSATAVLYVEPIIVTQPTDILTRNGAVVNFTCAAESFPDPAVYQWEKYNETTGSFDRVRDGSVLEFTPAVFGDEGSYRCVASLPGTSRNATSNLAVLTVSPEGSVAVSPEMMIADVGETVTFTCSAQGGPDNTYQWQNDGRNLVNETDAILIVSNITAMNGGNYTCVVTNTAGNDSATAVLYVEPIIVTQPTDILTRNGTVVNFTCAAESFPDPAVYQWEKYNETTGSFYTVSNGSVLEFTPAVFGDEGSYRCVASLPGTSRNATSNLAVLTVSPEGSVAVSPEMMIADIGGTVTFTCSAQGGPDNTYQWQNDGRNLVNETDTTLIVSNITAMNGGNYTCVVRNAAGNDSATAVLHVEPIIVTQPTDILTRNGTVVNFTCAAESFPDPAVYQWEKYNETTGSFDAVSSGPVLEFTPAVFGDEGSYRCVASLPGTSRNATSDQAVLTVSPEGSVAVSPEMVIADVGGTVTFTCSAQGGPDNTYQWQKNGEDLMDETDAALIVSNIAAMNGGNYTCVVSNAAGNDSATAVLHVEPIIVTQPTDILTRNGTVVNFTCAAESFPAPAVYRWEKYNETTGSFDRVRDGPVLEFTPAVFGDEGSYRCVASLPGTSRNATSDQAILTVSPEGSVAVSPEMMIADVGGIVTFTCSAQGGPDNTYQWQKNGEDLMNETDAILIISNIAAMNGGNYTCVVRNAAGNDSATAVLHVEPIIVAQPTDILTRNGTVVNFTCAAESFPAPEYTWEEYNEESGSFDRVSSGPVLEFTPAVFGDEGSYRCVASLPGTSRNAPSQLAVLTVSPEGSVEATPQVINAERDTVVNFTCSALGGPGNNFTWFRISDGAVVASEPVLQIQVEDAFVGSDYQCLVENDAGNDTTVVTLNVAPLLLVGPSAVNATLSENFTLMCNTSGYPVPAIIWTHNGTTVNEEENGRATIISENITSRSVRSTLTVSMAVTNDSGDYTCIVTSSIGDFQNITSGPVTVLVQDRPQQPQNVGSVNITSRSISLEWTEPHDNNAPIMGYRVMYQQPTFLGGDIQIVNSTVEMADITELHPGVTYNFTVVAFNEIGDSTPSNIAPIRTLEEVPSGYPQNVQALTISAMEILVTWDPVPEIDRRGEIDHYEVQFNQSSFDKIPSINYTMTDGPVLMLSLQNLEAFVEYSIAVRAYTSVGPGPFSPIVNNQTFQAAPSSFPQDVTAATVSSTEILVSWDEVPAIDQNGIIILYEVQYEPLMIFDGEPMTMAMNTSNTSIVLGGLQEYVEYNITVRAYTSVGPGPFSPGVDNRTFEDAPSDYPQNVEPTTISSTEILVSWDEVPAIDQNGIILRYEVQYEPLMTFSGQLTTMAMNTSNTSIVLGGLQEYVEYNITVRAYTSVGPGPFSPGVDNRTFEDAPAAAPGNLTVANISANELNVSWERPNEIDINGVLRYYILEYYIVNQTENITSTNVSGDTLSTVLLGLNNFTSYNVSVSAFTIGTGPFSTEVETTSENVPGDAPRNVRGQSNSSTSIVVEWDPPREEVLYGILRGFRIRYGVAMDTNITNTTELIPEQQLSYTIENLEEFTNYSIEVTAVTVGEGPYSTPIIVITDQDEPGPVPRPPSVPPGDLLSPFSVMVMWNPPTDPNGVVLRYIVNYVAVSSTPPQDTGRRRRETDGVRNDCILGGQMNVNRNMTVDGTQTSATLTELTPDTVYEFRVQAETEVGPGPFSDSTQFTTPEDVPTEPRGLTVMYLNSTALEVTWQHPLCDYGNRTGYTITHDPLPAPLDPPGEQGMPGSPYNLTAEDTWLVITDLTPNTNYNITVCAFTSVGCGPLSFRVNQTDEDAPQAVTNLAITSSRNTYNNNTVTVQITWTRPSLRNGSFNYMLTYSADQTLPYPRQSATLGPVMVDGNQQEYVVSSGLPFANYQVTIYAFNIKRDLQGPSEMTTRRSIAIEPTAVTNLTAVATSNQSIRVSWDRPLYPNGPILYYNLFYRASDTPQQPPNIMSDSSYTERMVMDATNYEITGLTPYTNYTIHVRAIGQDNLRGDVDAEILQRTNSTIQDVLIPPDPTQGPSSNMITIPLPNPDQVTTGLVTFYAVVVVRSEAPSVNQAVYNDAGPYTRDAPYYIAAAWARENISMVPVSYTLGDRSTTVANATVYTNAELNPDTDYSIFVRINIASDAGGEPLRIYTNYIMARTVLNYNPGGLAFGIILIIVVIAAIVAGVIFGIYWYRKKYSKYLDGVIALDSNEEMTLTVFENTPGSGKPYPGTFESIPVSAFGTHVKRMHANDDYLFSEEYNNVEPSHAPSAEATYHPSNSAKNRYANIIAYDHSRVRLSEIPDKMGSDYINGNFIDGYKQPNAFIATQGPVPDSVPDFWRMVWEQGSATIVMLTNLEEKGRLKCHKYWPEEKRGVYGPIRVHVQEVLVLADYTTRTFSLQKEGSKEERIVTQFHFTSWPDHGVPLYPTGLLHFVRKVASFNPVNAGPMVVHCSAGVGRTGTFLTIISQLKKLQAENKVDIFGYVRSMRHQRCYMVQTELQYIFLHDAILEAIECGVTEVPARDLRDQYRRLGIMDDPREKTDLQIEFERLDSTIHQRARMRRDTGTLMVNKIKNRYANQEMIPYDSTRVKLCFFPGVDGSDYINASYIDGYHKRLAFIATQGPLPDTTDDFWRMVWETKCASIVMLTKEREGGRVKCHHYWPSTGARMYGQFQAILHSVNEYPDYTLREMKLVDEKDGSSLPVKQFQYTGWPEEGVPDTGSGLIDLIGQVQKWQRNSGDKPIVVHCSSGCGRTGTFIAVSILLERLKTEGVVDVFNTVRSLRLQRPNMVQTVEQYEYCYKTVLEYLDSFELYANFK